MNTTDQLCREMAEDAMIQCRSIQYYRTHGHPNFSAAGDASLACVAAYADRIIAEREREASALRTAEAAQATCRHCSASAESHAGAYLLCADGQNSLDTGLSARTADCMNLNWRTAQAVQS